MGKPINYRFYWNNPSLISELPEEVRKKADDIIEAAQEKVDKLK